MIVECAMPYGLPTALSYRQNRALWAGFLETNGANDIISRQLKGKKIPQSTMFPQDRQYARGLVRQEKEHFKRYHQLMIPGVRYALQEGYEAGTPADHLLEVYLLDAFATAFGESWRDASEPDALELESHMPWVELMAIFAHNQEYTHVDTLPVKGVVLPLFSQAGQADESQHAVVLGAAWAISSWYRTALPLMALVEKYPHYAPLMEGLITDGNRSQPLPEFPSSLFSPEMHRIAQNTQVSMTLQAWQTEVANLPLDNINQTLGRYKAIGREANQLYKRMLHLNMSHIERGITILHENYTELQDNIKAAVGADLPLRSHNIPAAFEQWQQVAECNQCTETQQGIAKALSDKVQYMIETDARVSGIRTRLGKLGQEALALVPDAENPFGHLDRLNALREQHESQHQTLVDIWDQMGRVAHPTAEMMDIVDAHVAAQADAPVQDDPVEALEAQVETLTVELGEARDQVAHLRSENNNLRETQHQNHTKIQALHAQKVRLKESVTEQTSELTDADREALLQVVTDIDRASPVEVLIALRVLYPERVTVLPTAWKSAKEASRFRYTGRLLELLKALVTDYLDAINGGTADSTARDLLGAAYSARESETVMNSQALRDARIFTVDGEAVAMEQHLAIGVKDSVRETLRVHFKVMDQKVVIGHCGEHLPLLNVS